MSLSGEQYVITAGEHTATIVQVGAGLRRYTHGGVDVTGTYTEDELPPKCCGTTLVPWPNRIRDGRYTFDAKQQQLALTDPDHNAAIHGLGRWERWHLVEHAGDRVQLALDVVPQKGYPFEIHAEIEYSVHSDTGLVVALSARNDGTTRAPFGAGSHPFLSSRGTALDEMSLTIAADETFDTDEQQIPVRRRAVSAAEDFRRPAELGPRRFDQGFTGLRSTGDVHGTARVETAEFSTTLWYEESFRFLQVFTLDALTPGQPGIAIEPMTCAPDAFNSGDGLIALEPGESWTGRWGITPGTPG